MTQPTGINSPQPRAGSVTLTHRQIRAAKMRLAMRGFREGWSIFLESRIGIVGLAVILIFALMAVSHPILMATVWDAATYCILGEMYNEIQMGSDSPAAKLLRI